MKKSLITLLTAALAGLLMTFTPSAFAVTKGEVLRVTVNQRFQGLFGSSWLETVHATEPSAVAPVIITFSTDYQATDSFLVGLSVNGTPCRLFGPGWFQPFRQADGSGDFNSRYFQWTVLPSDGLVAGRNTFTLCGGAFSSPTAVILLGTNTLAVRLAK